MPSLCDYYHDAPFRHFTCSQCEVEHNKPNHDGRPFTSEYRTFNQKPCCNMCWWVALCASLQEHKDITEFQTQMTPKDKDFLRRMLPQ